MSDLHIPSQGLPTDRQPIAADDLARRVEQLVGLPNHDLAERLTIAVLGLLCGRLPRGQVRRMKIELPRVIDSICTLNRSERPEHLLHKDAFLRAVCQIVGVDLETARLATLAVFKELRHHLTRQEADAIAQQLPRDLRALWHPVPEKIHGRHEPRHKAAGALRPEDR